MSFGARKVRGQSQPPFLFSDDHVAGVSSGRLAVVISTPTIEAKAVMISFPKADARLGRIFSDLAHFCFLVTVLLLFTWGGNGNP